MTEQHTPPGNPGKATGAQHRARRVTAAEKRAAAVQLRKAGATFEEIAATPGPDGKPLYGSKASAYKAVQAALRETVREPARELVELEAQRLDLMLRALWAQVAQGHLGAIDRALRISERRAKLLGLDGPQVVQHSGPDGGPIPVDVSGMTPEEKRERLAELVAEAQRRLKAEQSQGGQLVAPVDTPPPPAGE